ncbi:pseudouridine synthase family protein [Artemisia annua]|uniref:Pseudouridine synthase family protein n=1 Tax=Artemisia annua TaxID=35608 RepID=A0A2U1KHK9_ARTAN|nr:pseudouridine synthase family protein [Artemisia annua]
MATTSVRLLCFSSSAAAACPPSLETLPTPPAAVSHEKWEPYRKKKVVMRVGYVGTDYKDAKG